MISGKRKIQFRASATLKWRGSLKSKKFHLHISSKQILILAEMGWVEKFLLLFWTIYYRSYSCGPDMLLLEYCFCCTLFGEHNHCFDSSAWHQGVAQDCFLSHVIIMNESANLICRETVPVIRPEYFWRCRTKNNLCLQKLQDLIRRVVFRSEGYWPTI